MKAIFIAYDQAHEHNILEALQKLGLRGYTAWPLVTGRGSATGEPHLGSHAWPSLSSAMMVMVNDDTRAAKLLDSLHALDTERPKLGLRAWAWTIDAAI